MQLKIAAGVTSSQSRLVSKHYGEDMLGALRTLQQNDMLCDFTVAAEGKSLRVCMMKLHRQKHVSFDTGRHY